MNDEPSRSPAYRSATPVDFQRLANTMPQLAWMADPSGAIFWYNDRWYDYTGTTLAEMQGRGWTTVHHPDHLARVVEAFDAAFGKGVAWEDTFPLRARDGSFRWFLSRAEPAWGDDGKVLCWYGTNTDVTAQKEAERQIEKVRADAEAANRAKSQFLANMSHELRTPLSAVIGYSEMLAEEIADLGKPDLLADVEKIEANARHLLGLINDVLDLSKIEAGRMTVSAVWTDVAALVRELADGVEPLIAKNGNRLALDLAEDLGRAFTDDVKLRQCLMNLVGNAAKFTENGTVTVRGRRVAGPGADTLVFEVADSGIGMTEEQVARLFHRFAQADESTTRQFGGTGLGLAITKALAERLGGTVEAESRVGQGSTFRLTVPAELAVLDGEADAASSTQPRRAMRADAATRVLIVDDDPAARDLLTRFLEREGFQASTAGDGEAGLMAARAAPPDAILLDVEMPRMNGWAVLHALKADPALAGVPVIMTSVVNEKGLGFALGATDYLVKPIERERLKAIVERLLPHKENSRVMLIDDDADARGRVRAMLARDGWTVCEAGNGRDALDLLARDGPPDLILLDLMMPVMDGFDFLRRLRQRPDGGMVPVVVLTAKDVTPEERADLDGSAERIISKTSLSLAELADELRAMMPPA